MKKINDPWKICSQWPDQRDLPFEENKRYFWYNFAKKFSPIKKELIYSSYKIMNSLFNNKKNILGVLARGTDYVAMKPSGHPIQPNISDIIKDVKSMDDKYIYDYIFFHQRIKHIKIFCLKAFQKKLNK